MKEYFALIKDGLVDNVIVADENFLPTINDLYDTIINVTERTRPQIGDSYYSDTDNFISNIVSNVILTVEDPDAPYLHEGTEDGFEPFQLSRYTVTYEDGEVYIGCKSYSAIGLLDVLYKGLIEDQETIGVFTTADGNPAHGKFAITWEDAQMLYDKLKTVKL